MRYFFLLICTLGFLAACRNRGNDFDASGVFEADEVIVAAEVNGRILRTAYAEGSALQAGDTAAVLDDVAYLLQRAQLEASIRALGQKTLDVNPQLQLLRDQLDVQQSQLATLQKEEQRFARLVAADAATRKQWEDIQAQADVVKKQMAVTRQQLEVQKTLTGTQNRSITSEAEPLRKRVDQVDDQIKRTRVINPVKGTVLTVYARTGELAAAGKPLYKIAGLDTLNLKAYVSGSQLPELKLGQVVHVTTDGGGKQGRAYPGRITWISDKAEFTPKTIQTKEERANLVYAIKVAVPNDGYLKIGMYGELKLK